MKIWSMNHYATNLCIKIRLFSTSKAMLAEAVGEFRLPQLPYFWQSVCLFGKGIFEPSIATTCIPHTSPGWLWYPRDSQDVVVHRKFHA